MPDSQSCPNNQKDVKITPKVVECKQIMVYYIISYTRQVLAPTNYQSQFTSYEPVWKHRMCDAIYVDVGQRWVGPLFLV